MEDATHGQEAAEMAIEPSTNDLLERTVVSTHVLVEHEKVEELRRLSRRTRIAQSEYLREAVDDLLLKYHRLDPSPPGQGEPEATASDELPAPPI